MSPKRPVIAVIPHYNMPQTLGLLISQILSQDYHAVYVLDDNSSACDIRKVLAPYRSKVKLIAGKRNLGAACNRNRILKAKNLPADALLHFIDADCELRTADAPAQARRIFAKPGLGMVGGL